MKSYEKCTIRLYRRYDADLLYIHNMLKGQTSDFNTIMKEMLTAYAVGKPFEMPKLEYNAECAEVVYRYSEAKEIQLYFNRENPDEMKAIKWLKTVRRKYRNSLIKHLFRYNLGTNTLSVYFYDEEPRLNRTLDENIEVKETEVRDKEAAPYLETAEIKIPVSDKPAATIHSSADMEEMKQRMLKMEEESRARETLIKELLAKQEAPIKDISEKREEYKTSESSFFTGPADIKPERLIKTTMAEPEPEEDDDMDDDFFEALKSLANG